jgi:hypothetical protein
LPKSETTKLKKRILAEIGQKLTHKNKPITTGTYPETLFMYVKTSA